MFVKGKLYVYHYGNTINDVFVRYVEEITSTKYLCEVIMVMTDKTKGYIGKLLDFDSKLFETIEY